MPHSVSLPEWSAKHGCGVCKLPQILRKTMNEGNRVSAKSVLLWIVLATPAGYLVFIMLRTDPLECRLRALASVSDANWRAWAASKDDTAFFLWAATNRIISDDLLHWPANDLSRKCDFELGFLAGGADFSQGKYSSGIRVYLCPRSKEGMTTVLRWNGSVEALPWEKVEAQLRVDLAAVERLLQDQRVDEHF